MNPNLLKQLAMVVKEGSISRAAERLFITQPTLTRGIQQLESRAGAPLLTRTRYGVTPTEIGARLAQIGERILADASQGEEVIRQFHSGYQREFTLGIDPLWEFATADRLTAALLQESGVVFHLRTGSASVQMRLLREGELDFLLAPAHLTVAHSGLQRELLFRDRSGVFAGLQSPLLRHQRSVDVDELSTQPWMVAGASAGFLEGEQSMPGHQAAKISFTGSIYSVLSLLKCSDFLVRMPARLTLLTGFVDPRQLLSVESDAGTRRDIALWYRSEDSERPDFLRVCNSLRDVVTDIDNRSPTFDLSL